MSRLFLAAACALLIAGCRSDPEPTSSPAPEASITFDIGGQLTFLRDGQPIQTIAIEVADTDSLRSRGMMQRTSIPDATGMLFIFPSAQRQSFWMQNTPSALDIMYFSADTTLLNVEANAVPFQERPTFDSEGPAQFVVEVPAGYARRYGLTPGIKATWQFDAAP